MDVIESLDKSNKIIIQLNKEIDELRAENEKLKNCDKTHIYKQARVNFEKQKKYRQCIDEIERLTKMNIQECIDSDDCYRAREQMKVTLQIIKQAKMESD